MACGAPASPDALNRAPGWSPARAARAEREGDDSLLAESAYVLGLAAFWQGRLEAAQANFEAAVERYRPGQQATHALRYGQDSRAFCLMRLAYTLWLLGRGGCSGAVTRPDARATPLSR